jgi:hypothetical protein
MIKKRTRARGYNIKKKINALFARIKKKNSIWITIVVLIVYLISFHKSIFVHLIQQNAKKEN